jgi:alginate O-acetyltransferase complex protein AlgI
MSLSSWLRDYLYIPLGGNRGSKLFQYRNLFLTMLLGGLWHGAAWTFIIWGAMHGGALIVHREFRRLRKSLGLTDPTGALLGAAVTIVATLLTFFWVSLTWIFFRAPTLHVAMSTARSFVLFRSPGNADFGMNAVIAFAALAVIHWLSSRKQTLPWWQRIPAWQFAAACGLLLATALPWTPLRYQPFIYFQF